MTSATVDLIECPQCARRVRASAPTCIYCGAKTDGAPVVASVLPPPALRRRERPAASPAAASDDSAVPLASLLPGCPLCHGAIGPRVVAIETWESAGITLTGKEKHWVRSVKVNGVCAGCDRRLLKQRLLATGLAQIPLFLFAVWMGASGTNAFVPIAFGFFYSMYLLKWGGYTWADTLLYGGGLHMDLARCVPRGEREPDRTRFPVGLLHALGRLALIPVVGIFGIGLGSFLS